MFRWNKHLTSNQAEIRTLKVQVKRLEMENNLIFSFGFYTVEVLR
jgi:hypothetical protein